MEKHLGRKMTAGVGGEFVAGSVAGTGAGTEYT